MKYLVRPVPIGVHDTLSLIVDSVTLAAQLSCAMDEYLKTYHAGEEVSDTLDCLLRRASIGVHGTLSLES